MKRKFLAKSFSIVCKNSLLLLVFFCPLSPFVANLCSASETATSSTSKFDVTNEERVWLREFFHDLLFDDPGAYVLYGTKPMSWSLLEDPATEAELAEHKARIESLSSEEKERLIVLKREHFDLKANFQKWEQIKRRFPVSQYLFGRFPNRYDNSIDNLFFVNIEQMIRTLLANYIDFRRVLGYGFDPFQVVFEVENRDSKFWNDVQKHHVLLGILLGFGRDNSWFFEWMIQYDNTPGKQGDFFASFSSNFYQEIGQIYGPTSEAFFLPVFRTYGLYPTDKELFEQYKMDRQKINNLYQEQNEVDLALEWLTR